MGGIPSYPLHLPGLGIWADLTLSWVLRVSRAAPLAPYRGWQPGRTWGSLEGSLDSEPGGVTQSGPWALQLVRRLQGSGVESGPAAPASCGPAGNLRSPQPCLFPKDCVTQVWGEDIWAKE